MRQLKHIDNSFFIFFFACTTGSSSAYRFYSTRIETKPTLVISERSRASKYFVNNVQLYQGRPPRAASVRLRTHDRGRARSPSSQPGLAGRETGVLSSRPDGRETENSNIATNNVTVPSRCFDQFPIPSKRQTYVCHPRIETNTPILVICMP